MAMKQDELFFESETEPFCIDTEDAVAASVQDPCAASVGKSARDCLLALVQYVNRERRCGYTDAAVQQTVKNLLYCCQKQTDGDYASYLNRRSPLHENVLDAALTMCRLGMETINAFDPAKAMYSTFMARVFINHCNSEYGRRARDLRCYAESMSRPMVEDESVTLGDKIGYEDDFIYTKNAAAAVRAACAFVMDYAKKNLSADEYGVFIARLVEGKSNAQLAEEWGRDKKSIENAYYRAVTCLRRDAAAELYDMLRKKYGYQNLREIGPTASEEQYYVEPAA